MTVVLNSSSAADSRDPVRHGTLGARLGAAFLGGALIAYARARVSALGLLGRIAGAGLVLVALGPVMTQELIRAGAARRRVRLRTTLVVDRPVREVFAFCRDFENFPRVVQSLQRVTDFQD